MIIFQLKQLMEIEWHRVISQKRLLCFVFIHFQKKNKIINNWYPNSNTVLICWG